MLEYIRRVGCIQFDPLNIVGRNPELVLQARVSDFRPAMLRELLYQDRKLLDGWDKMMAIYGTEDWPCFHRHREAALRRLGDSSRPVAAILPRIRKAIEEQGPLSSIDLDYDQAVDWPWAPTRLARAALESMYFWGELVIHYKVHTRKVYDFASRHLPEELLSTPDPNESEEQYHDWHVLRRIGGVGLLWSKSGDAWLGIPGVKSQERSAALARLLKKGKVVEVRVEGIKTPLYMRSEDGPRLDKTLSSDVPDAPDAPCAPECPDYPDGPDFPAPRGAAAILAPLDNLLWDRRLVKELFDFEYRWEVYKPVAERRYGYYVLPVLHGDRFVARFEPGRDKKSGALIIKNWWWEPGVSQSEGLRRDLLDCFRRFLSYLGTERLQIDGTVAEQAGLDWLAALASKRKS